MSDKQLYLQTLSYFSHILLNTTNLFKHVSGIRAGGMSWCFIWEPCSLSKWRACGCMCSTVPHTVGFLQLWHTPHYITLLLYGPQASAIRRCSKGIVRKPPPILKYMQRFLSYAQGQPSEPHTEALVSLLCRSGFTPTTWLFSTHICNSPFSSRHMTMA